LQTLSEVGCAVYTRTFVPLIQLFGVFNMSILKP